MKDPVNATERLGVFDNPIDNFLNKKKFKTSKPSVYGCDVAEYNIVGTNADEKAKIEAEKRKRKHKKKLALGAISKYQHLLGSDDPEGFNEALFKTHIINNKNPSNRLCVGINPYVVDWSLLVCNQSLTYKYSSISSTSIPLKRNVEGLKSNRYLHLSMFTPVSKTWEIKKAVQNDVQLDNLKKCELDLQSLLGKLNPKTKFLVRWVADDSCMALELEGQELNQNEWVAHDITKPVSISLWPKIYLQNWSFSKFGIKLDTSMTVAKAEFDMKMKRDSQQSNSENIFMMPLSRSLVTDIFIIKNGSTFPFECTIEDAKRTERLQMSPLFDFLKIDLGKIDDNCKDITINVKFVSKVRINLKEDLIAEDDPFATDEQNDPGQLKFDFQYYLPGIDRDIIDLTDASFTRSSIEDGLLVSSRTYTLSSDEIIGKSRETVKWCELLASYDAEQNQVNCEASYLINDKYIHPWDKNLVTDSGQNKKVELHIMIENNDQTVVKNGTYKKSRSGPPKKYKGLFNAIATLIKDGYGEQGNDDRLEPKLNTEIDVEWCFHILGQRIESSPHSGIPTDLDTISKDLDEMTEVASRNVGQCPDNIPFLSKPVRDGSRRVIVLIAKTERLMEKVRQFDDADTRVHIFNFRKSYRELKASNAEKLKEQYGVFPNLSDYGDLESGKFSQRLLR